MAEPTPLPDQPVLYHTPSSHFSGMARLALNEAGLGWQSRLMDIHRRNEQFGPWYAALNPEMTVPTLVTVDTVVPGSDAILAFAASHSTGALAVPDTPEGRGRVAAMTDRAYSLPVELLTFSSLLAKRRLARFAVPRRLAKVADNLTAMAEDAPDLQAGYRAKAARLAEFRAALTGSPAREIRQRMTHEAQALLAGLAALQDPEGPFLAGAQVTRADIAWSVVCARLEMCDLRSLIDDRPTVAAWYDAFTERPAFQQAGVWREMSFSALMKMFV